MCIEEVHPFFNAFSVSLTNFVSSSDWLAEVARADEYLTENFQVGLLTDDDINYDDEAAERCHPVGPNAKETVRQFSQVCNKIIPDNHPPLGFSCRGGFVTSEGETLSHTECRERYNRAEIKRSKKVCRKELRNRAADKSKWKTAENQDDKTR